MSLFPALLVAALQGAPAWAGLAEIKESKLPGDSELRRCLQAVREVEPMAGHWSGEWKFHTPREQVVRTLRDCESAAHKAGKAEPSNEELQLLAGLFSRYAYNLDAEGSWKRAVRAFDEAARLSPSDPRPPWFKAVHLVESNHGADGMRRLIALVEKTPQQSLPASFWEDYAYCASVTGMPSSALMALKRVADTGANPSRMDVLLSETAQKSLQAPDPKAEYAPSDCWMGLRLEKGRVRFLNRIMGVSADVPDPWRVNPGPVKDQSVAVTLEPPGYKGMRGTVTASIMLMAKVRKPGGAFKDFVKTALAGPGSAREISMQCPFSPCEAYEKTPKGVYAEEGGAHVLVAVFSRSEPDFPGTALEAPNPPSPTGAGQAQYFRGQTRFTRFKGAIDYMLLLDSSQSIYPEARKDFDFALKHLRAD